jgi:DegV family protein with EDD domain
MIKIVTDSTAYLPEEYVEAHDIHVVPLYVHFGSVAFREGVELTNAEFYDRLKAAPELPTTSQPSAGEFHGLFQSLVDAGHEVICLTISSELSGTYNSATAAVEMLGEAPVSVVDSRSTSVGLQLLVEAAVDRAEAGQPRQAIVDELNAMKESIHVLFVVDTLEYLQKGGRIGPAKALMGTMLKIKPILFLNDGRIEPLEQVRSKRKALQRMLELIQERVGGDNRRVAAGVINALVPEEAAAMADQLAETMTCERLAVADLGPVIGTHTGPGVVGVAAHCLPDEEAA